VDVIHDVWPDHAALTARFHSPATMSHVFTWPVPAAFPWPLQFGEDVKWESQDDPGAAYQVLWQNIESSAARACPFPIPARSLGRAQRLQRKKTRVPQFAPVKAGRQGDFQPAFHGTSLSHAQWIRQVRRFQAYARLANCNASHAGVQRAESWGAILRASGFAPDFVQWWRVSDHKAAGAPANCPEIPPDSATAWAMFDSLAMSLRALEKDLVKHSRQYAKFRRSQNPNIVFSDIRPPSVPGVDLLLQPIRATVEEVCEEEQKLVLGHACSFDTAKPIVCNGAPLQVIHHEEDAIWVEDCSGVESGAQVCQTRLLGTHQDLAKEFVDAWKERWMRHADVPPQRWETIIQFAKVHMPHNRFHWNSMTGNDLRRVISCKKSNSSHGLDGVRLSDLKKMPGPCLQAFSDMFHDAEITGRWPPQVVNGKVVSLAKVPTPGGPSDFRPITIFGLLYRCWSSFHAKRALNALEPHLPATLYGSRQGKHATQLWAKLLWAIECSHENQVELTGLVLDLQKAFNLLPRLAVFEIAAHVGIPGPVLVGWAGALSQMRRFFLIRHSLSEGVPSVTGFPEGCGLSCVAMVLVDAAFHRWLEVFFPLCTSLSYVDDWQVVCNHPDMLLGAKQALDRFVHAMDLVVDARKTFAWSVSSNGRKSLKTQGLRVVQAAKNLGAHVQFTRKHTNASLVDRVNSMQRIWPKLRVSASRYHIKIRALKVAAWPRALHAVAATSLSEATFQSLRAGAMKGVAADGAGSNACLQFGMIEHPMSDPQFWAIIQTFRCMRECGDARQLKPRLASLAFGESGCPENGISATLLLRLQTLLWHVTPAGLIQDCFGCFSLFSASLTEVTLRAQYAWQFVVAQKVSHRPGLANLHLADPGDTRGWLSTLPDDDQALFRKCLNGSHITQDGKVHCQEGSDDMCPYCLCTDSRFHRFWECERFVSLREQLPTDLRQLVPVLPEFLTAYGWSIKANTVTTWLQMLCDIPLPPMVIISPSVGVLHLFTDGSCMNQSIPSCRVASCAVVRAAPDLGGTSEVIALGPLPGMLQSAYRAEIFAVWQALVTARRHEGTSHIWSDCQAVVTRLRKLLAGAELRVNGAHFDLWQRVQEALQDFAVGQVLVTKVTAHQSMRSARTPLEEWCFWHNHIVDQAAGYAQWHRPPGFWDFYAKHVTEVERCRYISRQIQMVLLSISQAVVRDDSDADAIPRETLCETPPVPGHAWRPPSFLSAGQSSSLVRGYDGAHSVVMVLVFSGRYYLTSALGFALATIH